MPDKSATWELVRIRTGRDPEELLRELYVDRRFSDQEIADLMSVSRTTVNEWRSELGISRSDRTVPVIEKVAS